MRHIITILVLFSFTKYAVAQKYAFSPEGMMDQSQLYVDFGLESKLKTNGKVVFSRFDSSYYDTLNIRKYLGAKYNQLLQDTLEYFFVVNLTGKAITFQTRYDHLVAEEFGTYEGFGFKPISFFCYPKCGVGNVRDDLVLHPSEILIIKNQEKRKLVNVKGQPNCFMRLLTDSGEILTSTPYVKPIGKNNFYMKPRYERNFNSFKNQLAFKDK